MKKALVCGAGGFIAGPPSAGSGQACQIEDRPHFFLTLLPLTEEDLEDFLIEHSPTIRRKIAALVANLNLTSKAILFNLSS